MIWDSCGIFRKSVALTRHANQKNIHNNFREGRSRVANEGEVELINRKTTSSHNRLTQNQIRTAHYWIR